MDYAVKSASKHDVLVYREDDLLITDLFAADVAKGKDVLLLYQGTTKAQYLDLKKDKKNLVEAGEYKGKAREEIARRFCRLLSYSPRKINKQLAEHTPFRTMDDFGIRASNLFLYYENLEEANIFYTQILGMELVADYKMAKIIRMAGDSYLILVDATKGMHTSKEPKTVALALLTNQLDEWYTYLKSQDINIRSNFKPKNTGPHDGFIAVDPEGYLLEFERFYQHPENEKFVQLLKTNKTIEAKSPQQQTIIPEGLGFNSTITWLYYKNILAMQNFYHDVLGLELVVDQGWAKIYKSSETGFIGLVDEKRGMHKFTEKKAVNVSFIIDDIQGWFDYVKKNNVFELRSDKLETGEGKKYQAFVGYDPEGYFMEFDIFYPHEDNTVLMKYLNEENK
jgi:catechol 2,3-dioxygenase-like lactoylglutathione lyase family enzyme